MIWSNLAKLLLGFVLAIALLLGGGIALAVYFMYKVSTPPPKPIFANDTTQIKLQRPTSSKAPTQKTATPNKSDATPAPNPLEPGAYYARVTWSQGLVLRSEPNLDADRVGSAGYNQQIVVLQTSADKNWERVRFENGEQEGWVKAGNTERVKQTQ